MGIWNALIGRKTHCAGCGTVVPAEKNKFEEVYCSDVCRRNVDRLSSVPPPPPEESLREVREIPFSSPPPWPVMNEQQRE